MHAFAQTVKARFEQHGARWAVNFEELPESTILPQAIGKNGGDSEYYFYVEVSISVCMRILLLCRGEY
jgi:hypothetical protein